MANWGYLPLLLAPLGAGLIGIGVMWDSAGDDLTGWRFVFLFITVGPMAIVGPLLTLGLFWSPRHLPDGVRPRWLAPDWEVPKFRDPRAVGIKALAGPLPSPSSKELTERVAAGRTALAKWGVYHVDPEPDVPYLNLGIPGMRFCNLHVFDDAVVVAQTGPEDRIHERPFVLVFGPGDVRKMRAEPGRPFSTLMFHRRHHTRPRLYLSTASEEHELALARPLFSRKTWDLPLLERVLGVRAQ
ncbi:MAG: hypothetical protein ACRDYV_18675 [Acidimicrobiia bacterium]